MKKGLRHAPPADHPRVEGLKTRPDEEGIKTKLALACQHPNFRLKTRPDEEGIKTNLALLGDVLPMATQGAQAEAAMGGYAICHVNSEWDH